MRVYVTGGFRQGVCGQACVDSGVCLWMGMCYTPYPQHTHPEAAFETGGVHPTGMHSC